MNRELCFIKDNSTQTPDVSGGSNNKKKRNSGGYCFLNRFVDNSSSGNRILASSLYPDKTGGFKQKTRAGFQISRTTSSYKQVN